MGKFRKIFTRWYRAEEPVQPNLAEVTYYIKASIVPVHEGRKCVDGRYLPDQATGMIARPGGDCGYVMALEAVNRKRNLGLTPEDCFDAVFLAVTKGTGKFSMHTDQHCDPDEKTHNGLIGCGHLAKAANDRLAKDYDVSTSDVEKAVTLARHVCKISDKAEMVNLAGEHQERGVLIIESEKYTVLADNPELEQMYFIYDQQRDLAYLEQLVKDLQIPGLTYEDMKHESDLQLHATLQNLAAGLPTYSISFTGSKPEIIFAGNVPQKPLRSKLRISNPLLHRVRYAMLRR